MFRMAVERVRGKAPPSAQRNKGLSAEHGSAAWGGGSACHAYSQVTASEIKNIKSCRQLALFLVHHQRPLDITEEKKKAMVYSVSLRLAFAQRETFL